jgi:hypothetical protein
MASLSMLTILGLILRRGSGLPRSRKRGFKNTQYLNNQNDYQARPIFSDIALPPRGSCPVLAQSGYLDLPPNVCFWGKADIGYPWSLFNWIQKPLITVH